MSKLVVQLLGTLDYETCWQKMKNFTHSRVSGTLDELWLVEHPPVYTLGVAGKMEHFISTHSAPIVKSDRGGQVTFHGPGQLVIYPLINIKRLKINVKELVCKLEKVVIQCLKEYDIEAITQKGAPGVFVKQNKIASIGLRVRKECSYHGIALNVNMSLKPFLAINPCGYEGLKMCQIKDFHPKITISTVKKKIIDAFINEFRYTDTFYQPVI
jgi:lipoyl(octanoyl) transferase